MAKQPTLEQLTEEINTIINELESEDISIEVAIKKYTIAIKTAEKIHKKLKKVDRQITILKEQGDRIQE